MLETGIRSLADVVAIERVPWQERLTANNVHDGIARAAERHPDRPAIVSLARGEAADEPVVYSYGDVIARVRQSANLLRRLGIGETDAVTLVLPTLPETHFLMWGAETAGIVNPLNPFLEVDHMIGICRAAGTRALVGAHPSIDPDCWPKVEALRQALPDLIVIQVGGDGDGDPAVVDYVAEAAKEPGDRLTFERSYTPATVGACFHTGGTTGAPKVARLTHSGQMLHAWTYGNAFMGQVHHMPVGVPMFHVGGSNAWGLAPLTRGDTVTLLGPMGYRNPGAIRDFYPNAARLGWTVATMVPAVLSMLLQQPHEAHDLSRMSVGVIGGSTLSLEVANAVLDKLGIMLREGWGMTEIHGFAAINPPGEAVRVGSVGLRLPYTEIRIAELDGAGGVARDCGTDEIGVILCRGPQVFAGYVDPAHDAKAWVDGDWFDTGDLGRIDADGYIYLTGRAKDVIIRGGHNIDPALIEDALYAHPDIALAAAVGRPDRRVGEMPMAYVQFKPGKSVDEAALKAFVAERIAERAANPVEIVTVDAMPLTAVGKIFKPALRNEATQRLFRRELAPLAEELGVTVDVEVAAHKVHGILATIRIGGGGDFEAAAARARELLGAYPVRFELAPVDE